MRTVTIQCGACVTVKVKRGEMPCPFCGAIVRTGEEHSCRLQTTLDAVGTNGGKATVEVRQPHKGAK
jgi:predicted RNA-binding Zn-ribbon protein involved in translation (DUF1610 family)